MDVDAMKANVILDKLKLKCFNCEEFGHFAKECKKPPKYGAGQTQRGNFQQQGQGRGRGSGRGRG